VVLSDPAASHARFDAPPVGPSGAAFTFQLTVTDAGGLSDTDSVVVNVSDRNRAPVADAGPDRNAVAGVTVTLDAVRSADPDGSIAAYRWSQTAGAAVTLSDPDAAAPTFVAPAGGPSGQTLVFQLTVTDDGGLSGTDSVEVRVSADPAPSADDGLLEDAEDATPNLQGKNAPIATPVDGGGGGCFLQALW
jgi:hypothetical protein